MSSKFKKGDVVVIHDHVCGNPNCVEGIIGVVIGYASCGCPDRVSVQIDPSHYKVTYKSWMIEKIGTL